jgi:hypothetical protein
MSEGPLRPVPGPPPGHAPDADDAAALDGALARLETLDGLVTADHVGVLETVHDALVAELARTED